MKTNLFCTAVLCLCFNLVSAQVPQMLNYQGVARNPAGNAITFKEIKLRLSIRDITPTGAIVYSETRNVTTNAFGLFNIAIGSAGANAVIGSIGSVPWGTGNKYLQVEIDPENGSTFTNMGTSQLLSVPFAMFAASSTPGGAAGGDLSGSFPNPVIANGVVTAAKLAPGVIPTSLPPVGAAGGDLSGTFPNPVIDKIKGRPVSATAPVAGDVLKFDGTNWAPASPGGGGGSLTLPFSATLTSATDVFSIANNGDGTSLNAVSNSTTSSIASIRGTVSSASPGGFSSALRGVNNGTGGLGIGVWGSQNGSGWGVYGVTPSGIGVYGNATAGGYGVFANSGTGVGLYSTSSSGSAADFALPNSANSSDVIKASTAGSGTVVNITSTGNGAGVRSSTGAGFAIQGITSAISSAGIIGDNSSGGEAVVGRTNSDIAGAVVGRNDGGGYGVRGFIAGNTDGTAVGVRGEIGSGGSTGSAGKFTNVNQTNTVGNVLEVQTNANGNIPDNKFGNAASFKVDNTNSVAAAVRAEVNTIFGNFGAAAIFGVSSGTGGFGGLFHASNTSGNGAALIAITDGNGNAITANAGKNGNAVEANVDGTGAAVYGWVPTFSNGRAARFATFNTSSLQNTVDISTTGTNTALFVNHTGASGNLVVLQSAGSNRARIDKTGKGYFNNGTQNSGADIAEAFDVEGSIGDYQPGDVLAISKDLDRTVTRSSEPYSSLIMGVYATKPGVLLTEENMDADLSSKVPVGVVGVIPTRVCTEGGAIKRGDLLVTSSIPGVAMKGDPDKIKPGQTIGKALAAFDGEGVEIIRVFVNCK